MLAYFLHKNCVESYVADYDKISEDYFKQQFEKNFNTPKQQKKLFASKTSFFNSKYYQENSPQIFGDHNLIEKITFLNSSYETHSRNFHFKKSQCSSSTKTGLKKEIEKDPFFKNIDRVDNYLMKKFIFDIFPLCPYFIVEFNCE